MEQKGSRTEANLLAAFAGESQAYAKYEIFAQKARESGMRALAEVFAETAKNERAHAAIWLRLLHGGTLPGNPANLLDAIAGEHFEWAEMYPGFARTARSEGFDAIAYLFDQVAKIEQRHERRYARWADDLKRGLVFSGTGETMWQCTNCGHIAVGAQASSVCPVCGYPQSYFFGTNAAALSSSNPF